MNKSSYSHIDRRKELFYIEYEINVTFVTCHYGKETES